MHELCVPVEVGEKEVYMYTFTTKSGTEYAIGKNYSGYSLFGGPIKEATPIYKAKVVVGERAEIELSDGRVVTTSVVQDIVSGLNGNHIDFFIH